MHSQSKRPHTHDVRALCVVSVPDEDPVLVSGGNDAQLLVHSVPRYTQVDSCCDTLHTFNTVCTSLCILVLTRHAL